MNQPFFQNFKFYIIKKIILLKSFFLKLGAIIQTSSQFFYRNIITEQNAIYFIVLRWQL